MATAFEAAGDKGAATLAQSSPGDGQSPNLSELLHSTTALRATDSGLGTSNLRQATIHLTGIDFTPHPLEPVPAPAPAEFPPVAGHPVDAAPPVPVGQGAPGDHATAVKNCDLPKLPVPDNDPEGKASKVARESLVLGAGLGRSFLYGMASLPQRAPEIGASVAIGATLSTISKAGELGAAATLVVGAYFTSKFVVNAINDTGRWNKFGAAVSDTWHSNKNISKDIREVSDSGGNFAFDTSLSYASGYIGYKNKALADLILSVIRLPVPMPIPGIPPKMPLPPLLMGVTPYMAVVPAPFLYRHTDRDGNHPHEDDGDDKHSGDK